MLTNPFLAEATSLQVPHHSPLKLLTSLPGHLLLSLC